MTEQVLDKELDYDLFRESYKPHLRPEGMAKQIETVFRLDPTFKAEFRYLRKFLLADRTNWAEDIVSHLMTIDALSERMDQQRFNLLRNLYRVHADNFRMGAFDEAYLCSLEDVALFFIQHDIKSLWLAGAYRELSCRLIEVISAKAANNRTLPLRGTMRALTSALLIEVNQMQRCYTMYERHVSNALVSDLTGSPFLRATRQGGTPLHPTMLRS